MIQRYACLSAAPIRLVLIAMAIYMAMDLCPSYSSEYIRQIERPFVVPTLSGIISIGTEGMEAEGVLVEECDKDWKHVLRSTTTDSTGYFSLPVRNHRDLYYLRFSFYGTHTTLIRVKIRQNSKGQIILCLPFS